MDALLGGNANHLLGLVGEFSGHYGRRTVPTETPVGIVPLEENTRMHTFLFGPRSHYRTQPLMPYFHTLFGVSHIRGTGDHVVAGAPVEIDRTHTPFTSAIGGGVDIRLGDTGFVLQGIQADYMLTRINQNNVSNFRLGSGIRLHFGMR